MEQAEPFRKLSQEFHLTQEQIGDRGEFPRESVSNYMRLLKLPPTVNAVSERRQARLCEARVLLQFQDPETLPSRPTKRCASTCPEQLEQLCIGLVPAKEQKEGRGCALG